MKMRRLPPRLSSLAKLCSLLRVTHYKIIYKGINNFTINLGSRNAGFPLEILSFVITISPKSPIAREMPYIYIFP